MIDALKNLKSPTEPQAPRDYIVPPVSPQDGFILNLPEGEYRIRFTDTDGTVMETSERKIVAFKKRRAEGIGFEVIPGDKWTRPEESKTPASVLYVDGSTGLYLRPFYQQEYNDLYYEKLIKNDAKGNPNVMKWVRTQQVPKAQFEVTGFGSPQTVTEEPYYVEQAKGAQLGYTIVPYDPEGAHKDREPSLIAFHIPVSQQARLIKLQVRDKDGSLLPGSERQIRVIGGSRLRPVLVLMTLLPLLVMGFIRARRARKYIQPVD